MCNARGRCSFQYTLLALLALFLNCGVPAAATELPDTTIGISERLGEKIPLDTPFIDEEGRQITLGQLITTPTIILPVYYSCANVCYNLQQGLARVLPTLKSVAGTDYRVISFSFDEQEKPALAAKFKRVYLGSMHTPFPGDAWHFLTGDTAAIQKLTNAAGYGFQRRGRDFLHPAASFIVTPDGTIVRYLYGTSFLAKDLTLALIEARNGVSGKTIRKMVDFCFSFDPGQQTYVFNLLRVSATVVILCTGGFLAFLIFGGKRKE